MFHVGRDIKGTKQEQLHHRKRSTQFKKKKSITDGKTCGVIWINTQSFKRSIFIFHVHTHPQVYCMINIHTCPFLSSQLRENNSRQENNSYINILNLQGGLSVCPNLPLIKLMSQNYCSHPPFLFIYSIYPT